MSAAHGFEAIVNADGISGYMHPRYAHSLAEFGRPRELPRCGGWLLEREVPGFAARDAMGCYPLFACRDWRALHLDIESLAADLVCVSLVTDPFGDYDEAYLRACFPDVCLPFKEHYVIDLQRPREETVSKHHRYYARRALREVAVDEHPEPGRFLDEWLGLHGHLVRKHDVRGIRAFSRTAFAEQLRTPGIAVLRATRGENAVAAILYFLQDDVAFAHVLGCTEIGYELGALYALLWSGIERFADRARWCDLMGVPGLDERGAAGIRRFKRGFTCETRTAYLCGRILDRDRYAGIVGARRASGSAYFPAYREGEMA